MSAIRDNKGVMSQIGKDVKSIELNQLGEENWAQGRPVKNVYIIVWWQIILHKCNSFCFKQENVLLFKDPESNELGPVYL